MQLCDHLNVSEVTPSDMGYFADKPPWSDTITKTTEDKNRVHISCGIQYDYIQYFPGIFYIQYFPGVCSLSFSL